MCFIIQEASVVELGAFVYSDIKKGEFTVAVFMCELNGEVYLVDLGCKGC